MIPPPLSPPAAADFCLQRFCRTLLRFLSLSLSLSLSLADEEEECSSV